MTVSDFAHLRAPPSPKRSWTLREVLFGRKAKKIEKFSAEMQSAVESLTVTVLVPCFKEERHVSATLKSILVNRTKKRPIEIIVVDDCSPDASG